MALEDEIFLAKKPVDSTTLGKGADSEEPKGVEGGITVSTSGMVYPDTSFWAKYGRYSLVVALTLIGVGVTAYVVIKNRNK